MPVNDDSADEDEDIFETTEEVQLSLVLVLQTLDYVTSNLRKLLLHQEGAAQYAEAIAKLTTAQVLCSNQAARLAEHLNIRLPLKPNGKVANGD
jgi:hypothetical protein